VFLVGFRDDLDVEWSFPEETHSADSLLWSQYVTGEYWDRHGITRPKSADPSEPMRGKVARIRDKYGLFGPSMEPCRTVRDAIGDLPTPYKRVSSRCRFRNHEFRKGARPYPGHTGSGMDQPAKALKAGDHGVPGGENMLRDKGLFRYFSVRESARLQGFPDAFEFAGSWTENMRQIGNAVPVKLSRLVGESIATHLD
jgi:DNA (cytosine-5)-methyltransferase 1